MKVLFLCTGNSARSILAEAILAHDGAGRFSAYSAGSQPAGKVNPYALRTLEGRGYPASGFSSKSWQAFAQGPPIRPHHHGGDSAAAETCPVWPGRPVSAHWGIPDPAALTGSGAEKEAAFALAFERMKRRIDRLLALPFDVLPPEALAAELRAIGKGAETA